MLICIYIYIQHIYKVSPVRAWRVSGDGGGWWRGLKNMYISYVYMRPAGRVGRLAGCWRPARPPLYVASSWWGITKPRQGATGCHRLPKRPWLAAQESSWNQRTRMDFDAWLPHICIYKYIAPAASSQPCSKAANGQPAKQHCSMYI